MVQLFPRITYYEETQMELAFSPIPSSRTKRAIGVAAILLSLLVGLGIAGATGVGTSALILQDKNYRALQVAIDSDLKNLEQSITKLEESLNSLAEVTLQNRRGLDLLFMQQGGLCAALGEECCFYVNHSGVIRDSMTLLRKRIKDREPKSSGWYEQLFNWSPWLTTLLSALAGPIILLLLMLTIGPCIINRLLTFIREWVNAVQLMVLRSQYQPLYTITPTSSSGP
jgi:hypothetical protein